MQAPQDYRDAHEDLFKRMCFWEYAGFFHLGMKTRDEKNAIIQHGTMALIRKSALIDVGGWGEWCITEDAELGLRLFENGLSRGLYREELRQGPDARQLRGLSQAALPLGLWRHDHHEGPLARPAAVRPQQAAQSGAALPVPGRLDAVDRRRAAVAVRLSGDRLERRHDVDAGQGRAAADALSHRHARHVLLQGRQVDVALCQQGAVQLPRQSRRRLGRPVAVLRGVQGGVARPLHLQPAVPSHARRWRTSRRSSAAWFRRGRRRRSS